MNDVIPGATYYDRGLGDSFHCNGVVTTADSVEKVRIEYIGSGATLSVPLDAFKSEPMFEVIEHP